MTAENTDALLVKLIMSRAERGKPVRIGTRVEPRGRRWYALLEIDGVAVLERGPCASYAAADRACSRLREALDREGVGPKGTA